VVDQDAAPDGAKWVDSPKIVERLNYRSDGTGFTDSGYRQIFVVPASGGTARQLTTGTSNITGVEWTPDGKSIL
jgi:Tol biopolymer transport system component